MDTVARQGKGLATAPGGAEAGPRAGSWEGHARWPGQRVQRSQVREEVVGAEAGHSRGDECGLGGARLRELRVEFRFYGNQWSVQARTGHDAAGTPTFAAVNCAGERGGGPSQRRQWRGTGSWHLPSVWEAERSGPACGIVAGAGEGGAPRTPVNSGVVSWSPAGERGEDPPQGPRDAAEAERRQSRLEGKGPGHNPQDQRRPLQGELGGSASPRAPLHFTDGEHRPRARGRPLLSESGVFKNRGPGSPLPNRSQRFPAAPSSAGRPHPPRGPGPRPWASALCPIRCRRGSAKPDGAPAPDSSSRCRRLVLALAPLLGAQGLAATL